MELDNKRSIRLLRALSSRFTMMMIYSRRMWRGMYSVEDRINWQLYGAARARIVTRLIPKRECAHFGPECLYNAGRHG